MSLKIAIFFHIQKPESLPGTQTRKDELEELAPLALAKLLVDITLKKKKKVISLSQTTTLHSFVLTRPILIDSVP